MILSMTGYGKAICELPNKKIAIEIKSLNSKQLDLNTRLPLIYREKDLLIRNIVSSKLIRGKVDLSFFMESVSGDKVTQINSQLIEQYFNQLSPIANKFELGDKTDLLRIIMSLPDTVKTEQPELNEDEWPTIEASLMQAIEQLDGFRLREGQVLETEITQRIEIIQALLLQVKSTEKERIDKIRAKMNDALADIATRVQVDQNRFEQELIFYIEKLDITEEKVRLSTHLNYFLQTVKQNEPSGKKLGFITQEIGREINTMGSKANDYGLQHIVIQMKDELEKIKEQLLNIL